MTEKSLPVSIPPVLSAPRVSTDEIPATEPALATERILREAGMRAVPSNLLNQFRVGTIQSDGTVSAEIVEFFSLGEDEIRRLNESLAAAASELREMELARLEVVRSSEDEVVLMIPAFLKEGLAAEEELRQSISRQLGEKDGALLWSLMRQERGEYWGGFGRVAREIAFRFEPRDGKSGPMDATFGVTIDFEAGRPWFEEGLNLGGSEIQWGPRATPENRIESLGRYAYLLPLLPEDMLVKFGFRAGRR